MLGVSFPTPTAPTRTGQGVRAAAKTQSLLWSDDFDGPAGSRENTANWSRNVWRAASNSEQEYYTTYTSANGTANNAYLDGNSNLVIAVRNETTPDGQVPPSAQAYTSARLVSVDKKSFTPPVKIVARISCNLTKGLLPAVWMMGENTPGGTNWPQGGEIDIIELPAHIGPYFRIGTLHGPTAASPSTDKSISTSYLDTVQCSDRFFNVGIDWYVDHIDFHVDGAIYGTLTQAQYVAAGGDWTPFAGASWPFYFILNIAVGNTWTGAPDGTSTFPQSMLIDWIKVWSI